MLTQTSHWSHLNFSCWVAAAASPEPLVLVSFPTHCPQASDAETLNIIRKSHCSQLRIPFPLTKSQGPQLPAMILLTCKEMTINAVFPNYYFGCTGSSLQHAGSIVAAWVLSWGCGILVSWPGLEPGPPALQVQCFTRWTTREVSVSILMSVGSLLWKYIPSCGLTSIIQYLLNVFWTPDPMWHARKYGYISTAPDLRELSLRGVLETSEL